MESRRWAHIQELFLRARELPTGKRAAFLEARCDSEGLRKEVEDLLRADAGADSFLDVSRPPRERRRWIAEALERLEPEVPDAIGRYRIEGELGRGGMGTVYRAQRTDGLLDRTVALKVIRRGLDTDDILRRFRQEWELLAELEHPHIARLYDVGLTDDGRPFFVMEYVDGAPITEYVETNGLDLDARLGLMQTVCEAVQFAHARLVLHRDLKPGNILVTEAGAVKLLDFGLARVLSPAGRLTETALTAPSRRMYTPQYASPEQVQGRALTTASDVYGLGVVLYEVCAGARPHRLSLRSPAEVEEVICSRPAPPPSQKAYVQALEEDVPAAEARALRSRLRGEIDSIALKALAKAPGDRYASAEQLGLDIGRYLDQRPISARPLTWTYRFRLLQRRAAPYLGAAAWIVIVGLLAAVGALAYGPFDKNPVSARLSGDMVELLNVSGQVVDAVQIGADPDSDPFPISHRVAFADLNGDGQNEALYLERTDPDEQSATFVAARQVGADAPLWRTPLRMALRYPEQMGRLSPDFTGLDIEAGDVDGDGAPEVLVSGGSVGSFAGIVLRLGGQTGAVEAAYVHPGRLIHLALKDVAGDPRPELLAGGRSNAFGDEAVLAVLNPRALQGHGPQQGAYAVAGSEPAEHVAYIRFPATPLSRILLDNSRRVGRIRLYESEDRFAVDVFEGAYYHEPLGTSLRMKYIVYFDSSLRVQHVNTNDNFDVVAETLIRDGHLGEPLDAAFWREWTRRVQFWDGSQWTRAADSE